MTIHPVRFGLAGLGGHAAYMCDRLLAETDSGRHANLIAVCEPRLQAFRDRALDLRRRGVVLVSSFDRLLETDIEAVCLPLPIDLHRPYTETSLRAGKSVLCEKPAAGSIDDVDAMIDARDRASLAVAIAFQDLYQPSIHELKRRLVSGEFGRILGGTMIGCWPRGDWYYRRNNWVGRMRRNGRWIMDSPANNALAHFVHLALFLMGSSEREAAPLGTVEAELYRANKIENYDTCSLRITCDTQGSPQLLIGFTHACETTIEPEVIIRSERATIRYLYGRHIQVERQDGSDPEILPLLSNPYPAMFQTMHQWMRHGHDTSIGATLETARAHTIVVNAASQAAQVIDIPAETVEVFEDEQTRSPLRIVRGLVTAMQSSIAQGKMLHESGMVSWSQPAGEIDVRSYAHFAGPKGLRNKRHASVG